MDCMWVVRIARRTTLLASAEDDILDAEDDDDESDASVESDEVVTDDIPTASVQSEEVTESDAEKVSSCCLNIIYITLYTSHHKEAYSCSHYLTLPYLSGKACYRLALRPPVGPMCIPELTVRLLKPLGVFSRLQE